MIVEFAILLYRLPKSMPDEGGGGRDKNRASHEVMVLMSLVMRRCVHSLVQGPTLNDVTSFAENLRVTISDPKQM